MRCRRSPSAESNFQTGTGSLTATARLDFQIVIPKFLYLRVGSNDANVNLISFTVPAANVGNGTPVAASAASGDLGNGVVTARVIGNGGNVTLSSATIGALNDGGTNTISYSQISTAASVLTSGTPLAINALYPAKSSQTSAPFQSPRKWRACSPALDSQKSYTTAFMSSKVPGA